MGRGWDQSDSTVGSALHEPDLGSTDGTPNIVPNLFGVIPELGDRNILSTAGCDEKSEK